MPLAQLPALTLLFTVTVSCHLPRATATQPSTDKPVAILDESVLPQKGCASSAETIIRILSQQSIPAEKISADDLADAHRFGSDQFSLLIIPTGEVFPSAARDNFLRFLTSGGDLITTGGYALNHLVRKFDGRWVSERDWLQAKLNRARHQKTTMIDDPGFEMHQPIPIRAAAETNSWYRTSEFCRLTRDNPQQGEQCARVQLPPNQAVDSDGFSVNFSVMPGHTYHVSGYLRAADLSGPGIAYMAIYQNDDQGKMVEFRDFGVVRQSSKWKQFDYLFTPPPRVSSARLQCGLHRKQGTACFDNFQIVDVTGLRFRPLNTSSGKPEDGLVVEPDQLGIFDASFPLKRVRQIRTAPNQMVMDTPLSRQHPFTGWAASGVVGRDRARWIPLLQTRDRYGRPRGAAAALLLNYDGFFSGSSWAYFGIDNADLLANADGPWAQPFCQLVQFLLRETYLHNLTTNQRLIQDGQTVKASVTVDNRGRRRQITQISFVLKDEAGHSLATHVCPPAPMASGTSRRNHADLGPLPADTSGDLYQVLAVLKIEGQSRDQMQTGIVKARKTTLDAGPELRFSENYFRLNERPMFLFGTDTYSRTYMSTAENPWTWDQELAAARDMGVNIYENLQYSRPGHKMMDHDWRDFQAMAQLTQRHQLVFMPCLLVGHNTAIGHDLLTEQSDQCRDYARHLSDTPGLLYYLNGDYQLNAAEHQVEIEREWRGWLRSRYASTGQLRNAWRIDDLPDDWSQIPFPPPNSGSWDDLPTLDLSRFRNWLTRRWNQTHVAAIREIDRLHPTTSEYYSKPSDGIDLPMTIDGQDLSNIGFFDRPQEDLNLLPLSIAFNDLRARGKGVSLGEYGVKTHPAWEEDNGATGYHIRRTVREQKQLFAAVAHYALGLGCCKVQNWCLRDGQTRVFPWGMFYPNQLIAKDVAYVHRNQSLLWRFLAPKYSAPPLTVCLANHLRMGNDAAVGVQVAHRTFADLMALHLPFNCIDDGHLSELPATTKVLFFPSPMAISQATYDRLLAWVTAGGILLVTGDLSYDQNRQFTHAERLTTLAGVRIVNQHYPGVARHMSNPSTATFQFGTSAPVFRGPVKPRIAVQPTTADVLATADDQIVMVRNQVGQGTVFFCFDPLELDDATQTQRLRRQLYSAVAESSNLPALQVTPNSPQIHVMRQPTRQGCVQVAFDTRRGSGLSNVSLPTPAGRVMLQVANGWPALTASTNAGCIVLANTGGTAKIDDQTLITGRGQKAILSLDGEDLRQSAALLIAPFDTGQVIITRPLGTFVAVIGEFSRGKWVTYERLEMRSDTIKIDIDDDRLTTLILLCQTSREQACISQLETALQHPDQIDAY